MQGFSRSQQFTFQGNASVAITASSTSSNLALPSAGIGSVDIEITNSSSSVNAWVAFGDASTIAAVIPTGTAANGYILLAGQTKVISIGVAQPVYIAAITASSTAAIYVTIGQGA